VWGQVWRRELLSEHALTPEPQ